MVSTLFATCPPSGVGWDNPIEDAQKVELQFLTQKLSKIPLFGCLEQPKFETRMSIG